MKQSQTATGQLPMKQLHVPKVFQPIKPIPQSLSNQQTLSAVATQHRAVNNQQCDFAVFTGERYLPCKVVAVSCAFCQAKVLLDNEVLTVSRNQIFQISAKEQFLRPDSDAFEEPRADVFNLEDYQQIQLDTLQARRFKPLEVAQPETFRQNRAYQLAQQYEGIYSGRELEKVFFAGMNRFERLRAYDWYCLRDFDYVFTSGSVRIVDDIWPFLASQRFCSGQKLQEPVLFGERCAGGWLRLQGWQQAQEALSETSAAPGSLISIPSPESTIGTAKPQSAHPNAGAAQEFTIMDPRYAPCRRVIQLLYASYQRCLEAALHNADFGAEISRLQEQYLQVAAWLADERLRALCIKLLNVFDFQQFLPALQFQRFQMLYVNLTRVIYCALLKQLLGVDIIKAQRMFAYQFLNFAIVEHISACAVINAWFDPPALPHDAGEFDVMLPSDSEVRAKDCDQQSNDSGLQTKEGAERAMALTNAAIQQDVRRKNLVLLQFLRKAQFLERPEPHFDHFPIKLDIVFIQILDDSNKQVIRTDPPIPDAIAQFRMYLHDLTRYMFQIESDEFYALCAASGFDYREEVRLEIAELFCKQETMQEYCFSQCMSPMQIIYEEYLSIDIDEKMDYLASILLLADDIIVDNFTLDDELRQINEFYNEGFILEIKQQTDKFKQSNQRMASLIEKEDYDAVELTQFYFYDYFQYVLSDPQLVKRANFTKLVNIFEFQIQSKKAFTYLLQDQLYFYCFCVDTGQLDEFFHSFEVQCYDEAQDNIMSILQRFAFAVIQNMRLFLEVISVFETNPFKFRDLSLIEVAMSRQAFRSFFNAIFNYVLVILEQITKTFGVSIKNADIIDRAYQLLFKLAEYEKAYGLKLTNADANSDYQFYKIHEIQELRTTQLGSFFQLVDQIAIEKVDEIFNLISAVHRFACILCQKYCLLNSRKQSYQRYINDLNLALIDKSAHLINVIQQKLFNDVSNIQFVPQIVLQFADIHSDPEHIFEEEFIVELQNYIRIPISSENFRDRKGRCDDDLHQLLQRYSLAVGEPDTIKFLLSCRTVVQYLKEFIQLLLVKSQWLQCLRLNDDYMDDSQLIVVLQDYYYNVSLLYNIYNQATLTDLQLHYQKDYAVRGINIQLVQETLTLFMRSVILFRDSQEHVNRFIAGQSIQMSTTFKSGMLTLIPNQLANFKYYYLFISVSNKNLSPGQFKTLSAQFNMNVQQSLLITVRDIQNSFQSFSSALFDYCQLTNAQLARSTAIYQTVKNIFLACCAVRLHVCEQTDSQSAGPSDGWVAGTICFSSAAASEFINSLNGVFEGQAESKASDDQKAQQNIESLYNDVENKVAEQQSARQSDEASIAFVSFLQNSKVLLQRYILHYNEFSSNLLQFVRDVEQVLYIMLDVFYGINVVQMLLQQLQIIRSRGNIVQLDFKQLEREVIQKEVDLLISKYRPITIDSREQQQEPVSIKKTVAQVKHILQQRSQIRDDKITDNINLLNVFEIVSINDATRFLKLFADKFARQSATFISCVQHFKTPRNEASKFSIKELYRLVAELYEIHHRILNKPYTCIFDKYQKQSSQNMMSDNVLKQQFQIFKIEPHSFTAKAPYERFQDRLQTYQVHQTQMQLIENHTYDRDAFLLPLINNQVIYINAAVNAPQFLLFSSFEDNIKTVLGNGQYRFQTLSNISRAIIEDSPTRGRIIVSFESQHERFVLLRPCKVPADFCECDSALRKYIQETLYFNVVQSISDLKNGVFKEFLGLPYQVQFIALASCPVTHLAALKKYIQENNIKEERLIPIANRLLELIQLGEAKKFYFQTVDNKILMMPQGIKCSFVWSGAPFQPEYREVPIVAYQYIYEIVKGFSLNKPVIIHHKDKDSSMLGSVMLLLQRLICRKIVQVVLSNTLFKQQFNMLQRYLLSGYIVFITNYQNIQQCFRYQVLEFVNQVAQNFGYFDNIYKAALNQNVIKNVIKQKAIQEKNRLLGIQQVQQEKEIILSLDDLKIQQISIQEAHEQLGYLVFDFYAVANEQKQQLFSQFQNYYEVGFQDSDQQNQYAKLNPMLGTAYQNIATIMKSFNNRIQKLTFPQYLMIHNQISDIANPLGNATVLMDQIMKSYMLGYETGEAQARSAEGFNNYSFRHQKQMALDLQHARQLGFRSKLQALMNDFQLIGNLISQQFRLTKSELHQINNQVKYYCSVIGKSKFSVRTKKSFYNQYIAEFVYNRLNEKTHQFLQQCVHQFQVSLGIAYDIYYVSLLLKRQIPVLLSATNYEYLHFILEVANTVVGNEGQIVYINSIEHLKSIVLENDRQYVITALSQAQVDNYIETLYAMNIDGMRLSLFFSCASKAAAVYNAFFQYRMTCLGEIKDIIGFKLYFVQNINLFSIDQLQKLYISQIHKQCDAFQTKLYRMKLLNGTFNGFTILLFHILSKIFSVGVKADEYAHIRAIFDFFLVQFQILQVSENSYAFSSEVSQFEKSVKQQKLQIEVQQSENQQMMKSCVQTTKLLSRELLAQMTQKSLFEIQSFYAFNMVPGSDQHQCFKYQFTQALIEQVVLFDTAFEFVDYIVGIITICMWNAFSLFSQFAQQDVFITRRYMQFFDYLKNFDLEKYVAGFEGYYLAQTFKFLIYDSEKNATNLNLTQQKYSINAQIVKKLLLQVSERLPPDYFVKQFCYMTVVLKDGVYLWQSYTFGRGILQDISYQSFIKLNKQVVVRNMSEDQLEAQAEDNAGQSDAEQQVAMFMKLQQLQKNESGDGTHQQVAFSRHLDQKQYLDQFELTNMAAHQDIQPIFGKYNCIFFDDERTAMAVLIACGMLSMTSFQVDGCNSSGKTTLIKVAGLIVKQMVTIQHAIIIDNQNECNIESLMQAILDNYEVFNQRFTYQRKFQKDIDVDFDQAIKVFANQSYMSLENQLFESLKEFKFKHDDSETIYKLLTNVDICHQHSLSVCVAEDSLAVPLSFRCLKCIYDQIQVFHIKYNPADDSDRFRQLVEYHQILELGIRYQELESNLINVHGVLQLIDTSIVLESDNGACPFDIVCYKMPDLSISYLRQYLKYYSDYYQLRMTDEWIYSFLNGANLLKGSLPPKLFRDFKFIQIFQRAMMSSLPSYGSIVKDSKRYSKHINMSLDEMVQEMQPELWTLLVSNYDVLNQQYEQAGDKEFREILRQMVEFLKVSQTKPSYLQRIIALNHDDIFRQANIFSLFYVLNDQNASYNCIIQCQERITSLTLLGYLNIQSAANAVKLYHPWQQFGTLVLKQTINAVLIQLNLLQSRQYTTVAQQQQIQPNKFANKLFYYMKPLVIDKEYLMQKFPFLKIMRNFIDNLPSAPSIVFLLEQFLIQGKMKAIFDSGLITSNMYKSNAFYQAHIIQQYGQLASQFEPQFVNYIYQIFIQILQTKHRNSCILQQQLQVLSTNDESYFSMINRDLTLNFKLYFVLIINQYLGQGASQQEHEHQPSARKIKHNQSNLSLEYHDSESSESGADPQDISDQNSFQGLSKQAILSCKVPFIEISLNANSNANSYNSVVAFLSLISQYKVMQADQFKFMMEQMGKTDVELEQSDDQEEQSQYSKGSKISASVHSMSVASSQNSQFTNDHGVTYDNIRCATLSPQQLLYLNNIRHDRKIILDVQNIVNLIQSHTNKKQRQHKKQQNQINADLMQYIRNFVFELQSLQTLDDDAIEYLVFVQIIRFSILMALGIKPYLAFNTTAFTKASIQYKYNVQSVLIGICLQSMLQQYYKSSKLQCGPISTDSAIQGFSSLLHARLQQYMQLTEDRSILMNDVLSGNQFPDLTDQAAQFMQEPFDVILLLPKSALNKRSSQQVLLESTLNASFVNNSFMTVLFDKNEVKTILRLLSVNMNLNTELPLSALYTFLSLSYTIIVVNDLQQATCEPQMDRNEVQVYNQVPNILEDCVNILQTSATEAPNQFLQFNHVRFQFADLQSLFQISGCFIPEDRGIFSTYQNGYSQCVQQYCFITVNIYSQIQRMIKHRCPNFVEFTQLTTNMINFITSRLDSFFDTFNHIFLVFHYFEALASPAKRSAEVVKLESLLPNHDSAAIGNQPGGEESDLPNAVNQEIKTYQMGQVGKFVDFQFVNGVRRMLNAGTPTTAAADAEFDAKILSATVSSLLIRNILFTALDFLKLQFGSFQQCAQSCCVDGILLTCYMVFYQSGIIQDSELFDYLQRAKFCHTFGNCQHVISSIAQEKHFQDVTTHSLFLLYLVASCQEIGVCVDVDDVLTDRTQVQFKQFQKITYSTGNPLICMNKQCSKQCYLQYIHQVGCFAFPIVPLMHYLNTPIIENDPYYELLYNLCVLAEVLLKTTFLIDQKLIMLAACLLEQLKYYSTAEADYLKLIGMTIAQNKSFTQAQFQEILKKIIILDLSMNAKDFQQQFARTLSLSDNTLIFANFSRQANANNLVILRKFLQLRARKIIGKRQSIYIGQQMTVTNQSLHKYKIIIGCEMDELYEMLEASQMNGQDFVDQFTILATGQSTEKRSQIYVTTQYLLRSVFGNRHTTRYTRELELSTASSVNALMTEFKNVSVDYFKKYLMKLDENDATEVSYDDLQAHINKRVGDAKAIVATALQHPGFNVNDKSQIQDLLQLCHVLIKLTESARNTDYQKQVNQQVAAHVRSQEPVMPLPGYACKADAQLMSMYIVQTVGRESCLQFATGLQFIFNLFFNMAQSNLQFISFLNDDFILNLCSIVEQKKEALRQEAYTFVATLYDKDTSDARQISLLKDYQVEVAISNDKNVLLKFFVKTVLPQILQLAISLTKHDNQLPFYIALNFVMFSFLQEQFAVHSVEDIQHFIQQFMMSIPYDTQTETNYQFAAMLKSILSTNSQFCYTFGEDQFIQHITEYLPSVVRLSPELQACWVRICSLSFNGIVNETLAWFLKYHSVFIQITKCKNIFAAIVLYWYQNYDRFSDLIGKINFNALEQPLQGEDAVEEEMCENEEGNENEENEDNFAHISLQFSEKISMIICKQLDDQQLTNLPKVLCTPTPDVLFAVLIMCNALQPALIYSNMLLYLHMMHGLLNAQASLNFDVVSQTVVPNAQRCNTGVLRQCTLTPYTERQRIMSKFWTDMQRSYALILDILAPEQYSQRVVTHKSFVAVQLFQLAEIFYSIQMDYNRYIQHVQKMMLSDDYDPQKHYAYVSRLGAPPDSVVVLYYDPCIDIASIIKFVYYNCDLPIFQNIPLKFVASFEHQANRDQIFALNVDVDQKDEIERLLNYFVIKQTIYQYQLAMPIIITIPVGSSNAKNLQFLADNVGQIIQLTQPYICYVQQPRTLENSFRYVISLLMIRQFDNKQQRYKLVSQLDSAALMYLIAISIIRLQFNIHDNELQQAIWKFGRKDTLKVHEEFVARQIANIIARLDPENLAVSILRLFISRKVKSKIARQSLEESSEDSFQLDDHRADANDEPEVEEQQNANDEDADSWSQWDGYSDENSSNASQEENQLLVQTENDEQNIFSNVMLQLNLFESQTNIGGLFNIDQLHQNFVKEIQRNQRRKIIVKQYDKVVEQLVTKFKQRDSVYELVGQIFQFVDSATFQNNDKTSIRAFFNSSQLRKTAYEYPAAPKEEYPKLLESYLSFLSQKLDKKADMLQIQPQLLFQNLVDPQVNLEINAIYGSRTFGIFQNKWIFSTAAYRNVINEIMVFLKFKEGFLHNISMERLQIFMVIEQQASFPVIEGGTISFPEKEQGQPEIYHTIFRQVLLHNAVYDQGLKCLVNDSPESQAGFSPLVDLYVYIAEYEGDVSQCRIQCHQRVDFRVGGKKHGDVFIRTSGEAILGDIWVGLD